VALLTPAQLSQRFPWLDLTDVRGGSLGVSGEGWFDAYTLMRAFRAKAKALGVQYVQAEATALRTRRMPNGANAVAGLTVRRTISPAAAAAESAPEPEVEVSCSSVVGAAGAHCAALYATAGVRDVPVRARKRSVFVVQCRDAEALPAGADRAVARTLSRAPLTIDPAGVYFRPEGPPGQFIVGCSPPDTPETDPDIADQRDVSVDHAQWEEVIWPALVARVPAFEAVRVVNSWAGHYDFNTFDHNAIVGPHPDLTGLTLANGFSGHGLQQSPAVGRAVAELLVDGRFTTLDLTRLSPRRVRDNKPFIELNIV